MVSESELSRGVNKPSTTWNVTESGRYDFSFDIYPLSHCYSACNFTGTTEAVLYINAECAVSDSASYGVEVYQNGLVLDTMVGNITRYTDTDDDLQIRISNLDASKKYYFKIVTVGNSISGSGYWREG